MAYISATLRGQQGYMHRLRSHDNLAVFVPDWAMAAPAFINLHVSWPELADALLMPRSTFCLGGNTVEVAGMTGVLLPDSKFSGICIFVPRWAIDQRAVAVQYGVRTLCDHAAWERHDYNRRGGGVMRFGRRASYERKRP